MDQQEEWRYEKDREDRGQLKFEVDEEKIEDNSQDSSISVERTGVRGVFLQGGNLRIYILIYQKKLRPPGG